MTALRVIACCVFAAAIASTSSAAIHGAWTAMPADDGKLYFNLMTGSYHNFGQNFPPSVFAGLSDDVLHSATPRDVVFEMRREAGTIVFEGRFKNGEGAGQLTFTPNPRYIETIHSLGYTIEVSEGRSEEEQLLPLALWEVSSDYIKTMRNVFPSATFKDLRRLRGVDVTPEYVRDMRAAGIEITDARDATRLAGVGVTPQYVRSMRDAGVDIRTAQEASRLKGVDVTPKFVSELAAAGYRNLSVRELTRLAGSGVNGEYIREMSKYKEKP